MKKQFSLTLLICLWSLPIHAQSRTDAESKVLALERLWGQAAQVRDIRALESIFDDALAYVHIDGRLMTKEQVLADTKSVSAVEIVVNSSAAHAHGNVVIVTGILHLKGIQAGKPYSQSGRYLDTWMARGEGWVCVSSMTTPMKR
jgi:ketosteroid isomerase-like protein